MRGSAAGRGVAVLAFVTLSATGSGAQQLTAPVFDVASHRTDSAPSFESRLPWRQRRAPMWAPLASAVLPGTGQAAMGQDRLVAYVAVEAYAWLQYASDLGEGRRARRRYRALARDVARAFFSDTRPDGTFDYYERMEHFVESGVYDVVPGGAIEPEPDGDTYNGFIWELARQTYWEDPNVTPPQDSPAYQSAIAFYERRAVGPEYRWSWRNAQLEQDLFRRTIATSNDAFRRAITDLGVVLANHALSTVDALATVRVRRARERVGTGSRDAMVVAVEVAW